MHSIPTSRGWLRACTLCPVMLLITFLSGCASTELSLPWTSAKELDTDSAQNPIIQIIGLWQPSEGRDPEGLPCRGFAGQIFFLANRQAIPVRVTGDVRVYTFDDQGSPTEQAKPLHQFEFNNEAWNRHLQGSTLGAAYNVFIPYMRRGSHAAIASIRLGYTSPEGHTIFSETAQIPLSGRRKTVEAMSDEDQIRKEVAAALAASSRKSITIPLQESATDDSARASTSPARATSGRVPLDQTTSPDAEAEAFDRDRSSARLDRMEQLLEQMSQRQGVVPASHTTESLDPERFGAVAPVGRLRSTGVVRPEEVSSPQQSSERFRAVPRSVGHSSRTHVAPMNVEDTVDVVDAQPAGPHPLDDESWHAQSEQSGGAAGTTQTVSTAGETLHTLPNRVQTVIPGTSLVQQTAP